MLGDKPFMSSTILDETNTLAGSAGSAAIQSEFMPQVKPTVIGLYGIPGCGKSYLLNSMKVVLGEEKFAFYEGSKVLDEIVPYGLEGFKILDDDTKAHWRVRAIKKIKDECIASGKTAIVAGHFMFWYEGQEKKAVYTEYDMTTYTHILYVGVSPETVMQRRLDDKERDRPIESLEHLKEWQNLEKSELRRLCYSHGILFMSLTSDSMEVSVIERLMLDFQRHNEDHNLSSAEQKLDEIMTALPRPIESMLVLDADRTLTEEDTGKLFWEDPGYDESPLEAIFRSSLGYSYTAFRQAVLLSEESTSSEEFMTRCGEVAARTRIYPEFVSLLQLVKGHSHVGAIVVTCGLRHVWEEVLKREGLLDKIKVIGGSRIDDGFVVTSTVKEALVGRLQKRYGAYVWAFGDSPLDIKMLKKADQAIVIVGNESKRSKTMDDALLKSLGHDGFKARQAMLPSKASPRLAIKQLPAISLTQREFIADILVRGCPKPSVEVIEATNRPAAKLLMTPMRDALNSGLALCEAHRRTGSYLATEFVSSVIGCESYPIYHVQGDYTDGYRLFHEDETLIVALMRGGDPMARGVWDVFPRAMYLHAKHPEDIKMHHLDGQVNILLVDSVVNSGRSIAEFVQYIRNIHATIRIVVIAGVVQAGSVAEGYLSQALAGSYQTLSIVTLRQSQNKYTGTGNIDTGNRLFNTKHLA